jgi:hypothetical protein
MTIVRSASYGLELSASRVRLSVRALWAWCTALVIVAGAAPALGAQGVPSVPAVDVDHAVISQLVRDGVQQAKIISHIDLTRPFDAASQWTLVIAREEVAPSQIASFEFHGPILVCLVKGVTPDCSLRFYRHVNAKWRWFGTPFYLFESRVVYAGPDKREPLLLVKVCGVRSGDGNCGIATALYRYDRRTDRFSQVFLNVTGSNNNQRTRFIEGGPLRGDVIVDVPTEHAPYTYWIDVYRRGRSGPYARILRYRGRTHYGDGNPLAVIDSEMPEILRHFGLWHVGDPLPVPPRTPGGCTHLSFRSGEEWCR